MGKFSILLQLLILLQEKAYKVTERGNTPFGIVALPKSIGSVNKG